MYSLFGDMYVVILASCENKISLLLEMSPDWYSMSNQVAM